MEFVDKWIRLQAYSEIAGFILVLAACLFMLFYSVFKVIRNKKIEKLFISKGYTRKLLGVPSFGFGAFYGWFRESDGKTIDDRDLRGLSYKEIKEKVK